MNLKKNGGHWLALAHRQKFADSYLKAALSPWKTWATDLILHFLVALLKKIKKNR